MLPWDSESSMNTANDVLQVHFIDVGHGDAILVEENDADMLIDAGKNIQGDNVIDYLKSQNITDLDYVIATHPHEDHIGGMDAVLETFPVEQVIESPTSYQTKAYEDVLEVIKAKNIPEIKAEVGDKYNLGDATFTIIGPNSSTYENLNNYSVCIKLTYGSSSFVLIGDSENLSQEEMARSGMDISADVLKLGHHGSSDALNEDFLEAVNPTYAVISAGKNNEYGHPHLKTLRAMITHDFKLYSTDLQGTIIFTTNGKKITVNTEPYKITNVDFEKQDKD
jgi:competence protein ComEC